MELTLPLCTTQDQASQEPVQKTDRPAKEELKLSCTTTLETGTEKLTLEIKPSSSVQSLRQHQEAMELDEQLRCGR
jgi:hypothetical protein